MSWRCVITVPQEFVIDFANNLEQAQAGAERIRSRFPTLESKGHTYYPMICEITGPEEPIAEFAAKAEAELEARLKAKQPVQLELPLEDPPNDQPPAA